VSIIIIPHGVWLVKDSYFIMFIPIILVDVSLNE
jgi:hypothetical protein